MVWDSDKLIHKSVQRDFELAIVFHSLQIDSIKETSLSLAAGAAASVAAAAAAAAAPLFRFGGILGNQSIN